MVNHSYKSADELFVKKHTEEGKWFTQGWSELQN